jgi:hypothetical protein
MCPEIVDDNMAGSFAIRQSKTILARSCETESVSFVRADEKLTAFLELETAIRRLKANYGP